jgi:hypothetical protein
MESWAGHGHVFQRSGPQCSHWWLRPIWVEFDSFQACDDGNQSRFLNIWNMLKHVKTERQRWNESLTMLALVSRRHGFRDSIREPSAQPTHLGRFWSSQWKAQHGPTSHTAEHILVLDWEWLGRNQLCGRGKYVICNGLKLAFCWASDIKWPNTMKHYETLPSSTVPPFASKEEGCRDVWATWHI